MWKSNFGFFENSEKELYELCEGAEIMLKENSNITMYKLRQFIERLCETIINKKNLKYNFNNNSSLDEKINCLKSSKIIDENLSFKFNSIRKVGNKAVHNLHESYNDALKALEDAYKISIWYYKSNYSVDFNPCDFSIENINFFDEKNLSYLLDRQNNIISDYLEKMHNETSDLNKNYLKSIEKLKQENSQNVKEMAKQQQNILNKFLIKLDEKLVNSNNNIVYEDVGKIKGIGSFVKSEFTKMFESNLITKEIVLNLQDKEYSKKTFNLSSFPVIKKLDKNQSVIEQRFIKGHARFYDLIFNFNNYEYLLCSQWMYEKHYEKLKAWFLILSHGKYDVNKMNVNRQLYDNKTEKLRVVSSNEYLRRLIKTVGMSTFVKYYMYFENINFSEDKIIELFANNNEAYMKSSAITKANVGKRIFAEKLNISALRIIADASKVDYITATQAKEMLK